MAKKIKREKPINEAEQKAEEQKAAEAAAQAAAGVQDEFQARGFELVEWVHHKPAVVMGILGSIVAAGLVVGVYSAFKTKDTHESSQALHAALKTFEAPIVAADATDKPKGPVFTDATARAKAAESAMKSVAAEHAGSGAAKVALLYAGHAELRTGDNAAAAASYQAFVDAVPASDPMRFAGYSGLAYAKEGTDDKGAIAAAEAWVNLEKPVDQDGALLLLARLKQQSGDAVGARQALERLAKDFPESALKSKAEERLASLPAAAKAP